MKIHYQCSNCGKRFQISPIPGVPDGMYFSGCRAVGDAFYCEDCVKTWAERNGEEFDKQYKDPEGMFVKWWNRTVDMQCAGMNMQELEKILEEIDIKIAGSMGKKREGLLEAREIIRKHMNDGWIPVEERLPEKEYDTVLCVTDKNYYLVCVYNKNVGFRISDFNIEGRIVAWRPLPDLYNPK